MTRVKFEVGRTVGNLSAKDKEALAKYPYKFSDDYYFDEVDCNFDASYRILSVRRKEEMFSKIDRILFLRGICEIKDPHPFNTHHFAFYEFPENYALGNFCRDIKLKAHLYNE